MIEPIKTLAVERFLNIPELPMKVFENFRDDKSLLAVNTRVSRLWSEFALEYLWRDVTALYRLFKILAPMKVSGEPGEYEYRFIATPTVAQWQHFKKYSHRVRSITYSTFEGPIMGESVFNIIARTRTDLVIFPNLHTLNWHDDLNLDHCVVFIHSGVTTLKLAREEADSSETGTLLPDPMRIPHITRLNFEIFDTSDVMDIEAVPFLSSLCALEELSMLPYHFTWKIAQSLSRLQNLRVVKCDWDSLDGASFYYRDKLLSEDMIFETGAFPMLEELAFCASFSNAIRFVEATNGPGRVKILEIDSPNFESPVTCKTLNTTIPTHYQNLTSLKLSGYARSEFSEDLPDNSPFTIDVIRPLFTLSNLLRLTVAYWGVTAFKDEDLEQTALAFPLLEMLDLIPVRVSETTSDLTLHSILPFAHHCPHLKELGLFISTGGVTIDGSRKAFQRAPRMDLTRLKLNIADNEGEPDTIAFLLSWIFPLECELDYNREDEEWFEKMQRLLSLFVEVHEKKPLE